MGKFRKKPAVIEAEQFDANHKPLPFADRGAVNFDGDIWYVTTIHGQKTKVVNGDWIIPEPDGIHFYPCKPDIFEAIYDKVE